MVRLCSRAILGFTVLAAVGAVVPERLSAQQRGIAADRHFSINAPDQARAEMLLAQAQQLRRRLALRWLGQPLAEDRGQTVVHWELSAHHDEGTTWPALSPTRRRHLVWLKTSDQRVQATLAHEMVHVVLFTRFGDALPVWVQEGIAATEDDPATQQKRERIVSRWLHSGQLPPLARVLAQERIAPTDQQAYTAAAMLVEFLLARGSTERLFRFARTGLRQGWDRAAQEVYGWPDLATLQWHWHRWLRQRKPGPVALRPRPEVRLR